METGKGDLFQDIAEAFANAMHPIAIHNQTRLCYRQQKLHELLNQEDLTSYKSQECYLYRLKLVGFHIPSALVNSVYQKMQNGEITGSQIPAVWNESMEDSEDELEDGDLESDSEMASEDED